MIRMPIAGTERAITIDANVIDYYFIFINEHQLPQGHEVCRIEDFSKLILEKYAIVYNKHIKTEYEQTVGFETIDRWLKLRLQKGLAMEVGCKTLSISVRNCLRDDYGFDCRSKDMRYLQTCINTIFKVLITQNTEHFFRPHQTRKRRTMDKYLHREASISLYTIDQCCVALLHD